MASTSNAEELMRAHLEGAADPFPSLADTPVKKASQKTAEPLDTGSETSFPSLATVPSNRPAPAAAWGPRIKSSIARAPAVQDSLSLSVIDLSRGGKDGKPTTLAEVMRTVMTKAKTKIEASTQRKTGETTFLIKGDSEEDVENTKRFLVSALSPIVTEKYDVPTATIPFIIGSKGATLKIIRDRTGTKIDIPRRETTTGNASTEATPRSGTPANEDEDEPITAITIMGPKSGVDEAKALIHDQIADKIPKSTQHIRDVPNHILPFVRVKLDDFRDHPVTIYISEEDRDISVNGTREDVIVALQALKEVIAQLEAELIKTQVPVPKNKHRFFAGDAAAEIMAEAQCAVVIRPDEPDAFVDLWASPMNLGNGVTAVMKRAATHNVHTVTLPSPFAHAKQIYTYLTRIDYFDQLGMTHLQVNVDVPSPKLIEATKSIAIDFTGGKAPVDAAVKEFTALVRNLEGAIREVEIDWLKHRALQTKHGEHIENFKETHNIVIFFPADGDETSTVLIVHDPTAPPAKPPTPAQKQKRLDEVQKDLRKFAQDAGHFKSEAVPVDKKWHPTARKSPVAPILEEYVLVSFKTGSDLDDNTLFISGPAADVEKIIEQIKAAVEQAQKDELESGYVIEFEIAREHVSRVVGAQGAGVNRLRDQLDVKVDIFTGGDEKDVDGKKKKGGPGKAKVKITGRKDKIEEAKQRILTQTARMADETSELLRIPRQYHASLIGPGGKYVTRLEEKYDIKINFPRDDDAGGEGKHKREEIKPNEVLLKGGKKGVAAAKEEIMEAVEFEKGNNISLKFTVPTRAVARILGKGGAQINQIKDETNAQIDIDKASEVSGDSNVTNIVVRGTKDAINSAKDAIMAIANEIDDETTLTIQIDSKFHGTIIGAGGQGLKDLIAKVGGPSDNRGQAGLIHFPRQGEPGDEVRLRGPRALVTKLKTELEKISANLKDRIVLGVSIPASHHRTLIGRGGQHLNQLQDRTNTTIYFPGSRAYNQVGEVENIAELGEDNPQDLVKVIGSKDACEKAIKELKASKPVESIQKTISVPTKYFHAISQQGNFFRSLRNYGVTVDHPNPPEKANTPARPSEKSAGKAATRIDEDPAVESGNGVPEHQWQVVENDQGADEGDSEWTLHAQNNEGLARAEKAIEEAIGHAKNATHTGFLTLADRSVFPRIIGSKGANVARLREKTGADITIPRDDDTIVIIGSEQALEQTKNDILQTATIRKFRHDQ